MKKTLLVSALLVTSVSAFAASDGFRPLKDNKKISTISSFVQDAGIQRGAINLKVTGVSYKNKSEDTLYKVSVVKDIIHTDAIDNFSKVAISCDVVLVSEQKANGIRKVDSWSDNSCN